MGDTISDLGELADPFGIDPLGQFAHGQLANLFDPNYQGGFNEQVGKSGVPNRPPPAIDEASAARNAAFASAKKDLQRKRASAVLFTGGTGLLGQTPTASTSLLGY